MMDNAPLISVVMCTYNGEKYLQAQLESIVQQTRVPSEIILSDDGSSDGTVALARRVLGDRSDIRVVVTTRNAPLGPAGNFSSALGLATSPLIALADQDDLWHPKKLERLGRVLEQDETLLLVHSDAALVDESGQRRGSLSHALAMTKTERRALRSGGALEALLRRNLVTGATTMIRSDLLRDALPVPEGWVHDEWLALVAALHHGVRFVGEELIDYRQHGANQIGATRLNVAEAGERLREGRSSFFARKAARNRALSNLVALAPAWLQPGDKDALIGKCEHDEWRSRLPRTHLPRVLPVLSRWLSGHYSRYARGLVDVLRDLVLRD
jgi:glycosyltransferase involved in cell wall biosynthesis